MSMEAAGLALMAVYPVLLAGIANLVGKMLPQPYMDEIFHIPQAQAYCAGNFTQWDPKITTLPGLYLFSYGLLRPAHFLLFPSLPLITSCSVVMLRSVNLLIALTNLLLIHCLTGTRHGQKEGFSKLLGLWSSFNISLLPPLFFTSFLYYTDPLSTCLVLLTYTLHLSDRPLLASLAGAFSVLCRQTNIVWVFLAAAETAGQVMLEEVRAHQLRTKHPPTIPLTATGQLAELTKGLAQIVTFPTLLARLVGLIVLRCIGYITVGLAFLAFIHFNQGIVVGDRSAHMATIHLVQLCYFSAFFLGLTLPWAVYHLRDFPGWLSRHPLVVTIAVTVLASIIHWGTMAHPYLLADNRHFTFYLWRKVIMRHWTIKFLLIPIYIFGFYHMARCIRKTDLIFKLVVPPCICLAVVPQLLLEFRYFLVPFLLLRSQIRPTSRICLALETLLLSAVNLITIGLFLYKTFEWPSEPGVHQRFMW